MTLQGYLGDGDGDGAGDGVGTGGGAQAADDAATVRDAQGAEDVGIDAGVLADADADADASYGTAGGSDTGHSDGSVRSDAIGMEIRMPGGPIKTSNLSSLLRTLQAAVRDVGGGTALLAGYTLRRGPYLVVEVAPNVDDAGDCASGFTMRLWFANEHDRPLPNRTRAIFAEFFSEIATAARRGSQHTFWGQPASRSLAGSEESRMQRFISTLRGFDAATIVFEDYRLTLINGSIRLERGRGGEQG